MIGFIFSKFNQACLNDAEGYHAFMVKYAIKAVFQAYCKAHHLVQIAIFTDAASGRKDARIQYQAMPARLAQGGIGDVVVLFMDRFAATLGRPSVGIGIFKSGAQPLNPSTRT